MSKARAWAKRLANTYIHVSSARPDVLEKRPRFRSLATGDVLAEVNDSGELMLLHRGTILPPTTAAYIRWLCDTFEENA